MLLATSYVYMHRGYITSHMRGVDMAYQLCGVYRILVHIINEGMEFYDSYYWMHAFEHVYLSQRVGQHCNLVG